MRDPGEFNRSVVLRTLGASTPDGGGGYTPGTPVNVTTWAYMEPLDGDEQIAAMQTGMVRPHRFTIRYRPGIAGATTVVYQTRVFDVKSVVDPDAAHEELSILADEIIT